MEEPLLPEEEDAPSKLRLVAKLAVGLVFLVPVYYLAGMLYLHKIDDDPTLALNVEVPVGGSRAVAVAAALIDREVNHNRWVANDPWFMPGSMLDNMPQFQEGVIASIARFGIELTDHIARVRGSSQIDADADDAAGRLKYPGNVWIFEWSATPVQQSSESSYRKALESLTRYNRRLAENEATFERRADNLLDTLDRIASDIGSSSAALYDKIDRTEGAWFDFDADNLFYANKGRLYGYYMLLLGLGDDFRSVIEGRDLQTAWDQLIFSFERAAGLQPWVVINGDLDSQIKPNHLAAQGFLLLRARTQLREVTNILLK